MMTFYIVLFAVTLVYCVINENLCKNRWIALAVMAVALIVVAGFKDPVVSVDYPIYRSHFIKALPFFFFSQEPGMFFDASNVEPAFLFLCALFKQWFPPHACFFIITLFFAVVAVSLKIKCFKDYTPFAFYSVVLYVSYYFLLHELIQIRAGVAIGLSLYSMRYIVNRDFCKFTLLMLLAITFHYSAILFFPFYFVNTKKINPVGYLSLIVAAFVLMKCNLDVFSILEKFDLGVYSEKIRTYKLDQEWHKYELNPFNMVLLFQLAITLFLMFYRKQLSEDNPYGILFLKINVVSIASLYMCASIPAFAFRTWEMLHVVLMFLFPCLLYYLKPRWLAELIIIFVGICLFSNMLSFDQLMPYRLVTFYA